MIIRLNFVSYLFLDEVYNSERSESFFLFHYTMKISVRLSAIYCTYHVTDSARIRLPGFRRCWSVRLEQSPGPCPKPERHRSRFQEPAKNVFFVRTVLAHPAHYRGFFRRCAL